MSRPWLILPPGKVHLSEEEAGNHSSSWAAHVGQSEFSLNQMYGELFLGSLHFGLIEGVTAVQPWKLYLMQCLVCLFCKWLEDLNLIWYRIASNGSWGIAAPLNSSSASWALCSRLQLPQENSSNSLCFRAMKWSGQPVSASHSHLSCPYNRSSFLKLLRATLYDILKATWNSIPIKNQNSSFKSFVTAIVKHREGIQGIAHRIL